MRQLPSQKRRYIYMCQNPSGDTPASKGNFSTFTAYAVPSPNEFETL